MKICTITCHRVYNYGASLQAYALQNYLEGKGHTVKIIDYKPKVLILDEPAAGLDPRGRERILGMLQELHREGGVTIVMVSQAGRNTKQSMQIRSR